MIKRYYKWLVNAPISRKFIPTQVCTFLLVIIIGAISVISLFTVNNLSQIVFTNNVGNTERLTEITETMYICRVLGRDMLLQPDDAQRQILYTDYIASFKKLDAQMNEFAQRLTGEKLEIFNEIILSKDVYKVSMILSADIKNEGGNFQEALDALTSVTPIANEFFGSINQFLVDEKQLMSDILKANENTVYLVFALEVFVTLFIASLLFIMIKSFSNTMSTSLITLEHSVTEIANTGNMKINIPEHLFTKDEIGLIATATNKLKSMLLDYSFRDALTGGYNSTAYFEELSSILDRGIDDGHSETFWCIVFDMNNLKQINDQLGHFDGDEAIKDVHAIMMESFSKYGKTFRVGGDEFVSILFNCSREVIESKLAGMDLSIKQKNKHRNYLLSIACGYDEFKGNTREDYEQFYKSVDKRMYENKEQLKLLEQSFKGE